jgi:hypothetical protein
MNDKYVLNMKKSSIIIPYHISKPSIETNQSPNLIEPPMSLMIILDNLIMSTITERRITRYFTITQLIISTSINIESDRSAPSGQKVTITITPRIAQ